MKTALELLGIFNYNILKKEYYEKIISINFAGLSLQTSNLSGKTAKNSKSQEISDWVHIFETGLNIEFTNAETSTGYANKNYRKS